MDGFCATGDKPGGSYPKTTRHADDGQSRGAVRAERDAGGSRVITGFRFPAAEEPDRATLLRHQPDRLCHSLAGSTTSGSNPARYRPFAQHTRGITPRSCR